MDFIYLYEIERKNCKSAIALSGVGGAERERRWGHVNNVQYKTNRNCHMNLPMYNEYILIKNIR
jgi:hypothetical protein